MSSLNTIVFTSGFGIGNFGIETSGFRNGTSAFRSGTTTACTGTTTHCAQFIPIRFNHPSIKF